MGDAEVTFYSSAINVQYWPMIAVPHGQELHVEDEEDEDFEFDPYGSENGYGDEYGNESGGFGGWLLAKPRLQQSQNDS